MLLHCFDYLKFYRGGGILMFVIPLLFLALVAVGIFILIRKPRKEDNNLDILKNRLAKGEISIEQFEEIKSHLK